MCEAVAANNVALQHYGQKVVYGHVTTNSGRRVLVHITFDVMSVRKPLLSTYALKRLGFTIIFNHDYVRIVFRNETVNLITHNCRSYLHITLANGITYRKAMVMTVSRDMKHKKLQLVTGEQSPVRTKQDSLTFLVRREQQEHVFLLNRRQTLQRWCTTPRTFH